MLPRPNTYVSDGGADAVTRFKGRGRLRAVLPSSLVERYDKPPSARQGMSTAWWPWSAGMVVARQVGCRWCHGSSACMAVLVSDYVVYTQVTMDLVEGRQTDTA